MHKEPPPGFFDTRRPLAHLLWHGLIAGFILGIVVHFGWTVWRKDATAAARPAPEVDGLVSGITARPTGPGTPTPAASPALQYR